MAVVMFTFVVVLIIIGLVKLSLKPTRFPPGPTRWPFVGNLSLLSVKDEALHIKLIKLAKTYGPVTGFFVGPVRPFISVVGYKAVKEALLNDDLIGRPSSAVLRSRSFGEILGLIFTDGPMWQEQRRFTLRHLRDLGFGKTSIEDQMMDEVQDLVKDIQELAQSDKDRVVHFTCATFNVSVINILWTIIGGKRFQRDDIAFKKLLHNMDLFLKSTNPTVSNLPIPEFLIRQFPTLPKLLGVDTQLFIPVQNFIRETIEEHLTTRSEGEPPRDFLDVYLDEIKERSQKNEPSSFSHQQLIIAIQDLFMAGSDTSSNATGFALLYLIHHLDVQRRMQQELDEICGESLPSLAHRSSLPYTDAVLTEVLRMGSIAPFPVPHVALKDTTVQGFHIPKGSVLAINLYSVNRDDTMWENPNEFNPQRHLKEDGNTIKNEAFIPFGIGKRMCLGEPLARNTVFLFVATLVKTFEFKPVSGEPLPTLEPIAGLTLSPNPYKAVVTLRTTTGGGEMRLD